MSSKICLAVLLAVVACCSYKGLIAHLSLASNDHRSLAISFEPSLKDRAAALLSSTPLLFHSDGDNSHAFVARSPQFSVRVHGAGFALARSGQADVLTVDLVGASPARRPVGERRHGGALVNHYRGSDARQWRSGVPLWERVRVADAYDGVDVVYYTSTVSGQLEFDFELRPGADYRCIGMRFAAAWSLSLDGGKLMAAHPVWGTLSLPPPVIYQPQADRLQLPVDGGYSLDSDANLVTFWLGDYDAALPLIIDPVVYSTYLGGSSDNRGLGIAADGANNMYVCGVTSSTNFPTTSNAYDKTHSGSGYDVYVTKFASNGALAYSTYLGGSNSDYAYGIAVDGSGNMVITGYTLSSNFPTTSSAYDKTLGGTQDAFVAKLSSTGALVYSTYLGGSNSDYANRVAVDGSGNMHITGYTLSSNFPTTAGAHDTSLGGTQDAFVAKFSAAGALVYSTYLGGSGVEIANDIAVDSSGNMHVTGQTSSTDYTTTSDAIDKSLGGAQDAFVAKFSAAGALVYSTYLGGAGADGGQGIAVDSSGNIAVVGDTDSTNFPRTPNAYSKSIAGSNDAFVCKFNASGKLVYSTYLGGASNDIAYDVAFDVYGNMAVTGYTNSANFPTTAAAFDKTSNGDLDAFIAKIDAAGVLIYSTYLGGTLGDIAYSIAANNNGYYFVVGTTASTNFPTTSSSLSQTLTGSTSGFVSKFFDCANLHDCSSHGSCIGPNSCLCLIDWTAAADCSQPVCSRKNNCSAHGNCVAPNTCSCLSGWTAAADCSAFECYARNNCSSRGNCTGPNTCSCEEGWTAAADCSAFECYARNNCSSHGNCTGPNTCTCEAGWTAAADCSAFECDALNDCSSHGNCTGPNTCACNPGWSAAADCSAFECAALNDCSSHGNCTGPNTCTCDAGWTTAPDCSVFECFSQSNCLGHGNCTAANTCSCDAGWTAASDCSVFECYARNNCSSHGNCTGPNTCTCEAGWSAAADCSAFECAALNDCSSHGNCTRPNVCTCEAGWTAAADCSAFECAALNDCSSHGNCTGPNTCACEVGWTAQSNCSAFECFDLNDCSTRGNCTGPNTCTCDAGWTTAPDCSVFECFDQRNCSSHGQCTGPNTCSCDAGWTVLPNCSVFECLELSDCSSHGHCIGPNTCSCEAGWTAAADCGQPTCYAQANCSAHGLCVAPDTCDCATGWRAAADCGAFECYELANCSLRGQCIGPNACKCQAGWTQADCSRCPGLSAVSFSQFHRRRRAH